jgi:hypothetical protein
MSKNQTVRGQYTTFNLGSTNLTPRLHEALQVLDQSKRTAFRRMENSFGCKGSGYPNSELMGGIGFEIRY